MKKILLYLTSFCIVAGAGYGASIESAKEKTQSDIMLTNIVAGQSLESPITIEGTAPGPWFFEAVFPIQVVDQDGVLVGQSYAEAQGEWMTEGRVPFIAKVPYTLAKKFTTKGNLIFKKDNPSGMPERDVSFELPVTLLP